MCAPYESKTNNKRKTKTQRFKIERYKNQYIQQQKTRGRKDLCMPSTKQNSTTMMRRQTQIYTLTKTNKVKNKIKNLNKNCKNLQHTRALEVKCFLFQFFLTHVSKR